MSQKLRREATELASLPCAAIFLLLVNPPQRHLPRFDADHTAHSLRLCIQRRVLQEAPNGLRDRLVVDFQMDQAVPFVTQAAILEITVECKERRPVQLI